MGIFRVCRTSSKRAFLFAVAAIVKHQEILEVVVEGILPGSVLTKTSIGWPDKSNWSFGAVRISIVLEVSTI